MDRPVLVVEHEAICPPGWLGQWLVEHGCGLDVRRPYLGEVVPVDFSDHAAMVVLGGTMDAYSDASYPWLTRVKELVRRAADTGVPALGICLGHQLAAVALGGEVEVNPRGQQIGVLEVGWTPPSREDLLLGPLTRADVAVQWNNDIVTKLPAGAEVLARAASGEVQAARFAPTVWGVQWHPEAGEQIVTVWADQDRDSAAERGVDLDKYVGDVAAASDLLRVSWRPLARAFADVVMARSRPW